jgi:hypothetical protein
MAKPLRKTHEQDLEHCNHKNYFKNGHAKWDLRTLRFDGEGRLYVRDRELAEEIQRAMRAWGGRFCIVRDLFPTEKRRFTDLADYGKGNGGKKPDVSNDPAGNQVNMMCPCAPEPLP